MGILTITFSIIYYVPYMQKQEIKTHSFIFNKNKISFV
jgi:hypothetical protein